MGIANVLAEDRRLVVLRALAEADGFRLNEAVLKKVLAAFGHHVASDLVRADIAYLQQHALVRLEELPLSAGELWLATLTEAGGDVAAGRLHPGVARRSPK